MANLSDKINGSLAEATPTVAGVIFSPVFHRKVQGAMLHSVLVAII